MPMRTSGLALGFLLATFGQAGAAVFYPSHFTLANGLEIVVVPNHLAPVVSQMVWYKVGSVDEKPGKTGLAHYLEHLMFRGTEAVPPGEYSKAIAAQGGHDNAFTSHDYTAYYEQAAADRLPMIMQMEADRMQNLRVAKETADPERRVIVEERQERTDNNPAGMFVEKLQRKLMPEYPYGRPIIGWMKDIKKLTAADARKFYDTHYAPNNAVVVISGDVKVDDVVSLAAATFGRVPKRDVPSRRSFRAAPESSTRDFVMRDARIEQPEVLWRFLVPSYATQTKAEAYAYEVLSEVLAGGEVGLFYKALVKDQEIASDLGAGYDPDARGDTEFTITASLRPGQPDRKLREALRKVLAETAEAGIPENEVESAKNRMKRSAIFARESLTMPGYAFGMALTTGHSVADVEAWPDRIDTVTVGQVNDALRALASSKRQIMGSLLPVAKHQSLKSRASPSKPSREGAVR